jgi:hypothetical protein
MLNSPIKAQIVEVSGLKHCSVIGDNRLWDTKKWEKSFYKSLPHHIRRNSSGVVHTNILGKPV